jgi:hypothetical protein
MKIPVISEKDLLYSCFKGWFIMEFRVMIITFNDNKLNSDAAPKIRGNFANLFPQYPELHHHIEESKLLYKYPLIQYKIVENIPMILGIDKGFDILKGIYNKVNALKIGSKDTQDILEKCIKISTDSFKLTEKRNTYSFLTPWLALNEKNYEQYQKLGTWVKRKELLEKILVGNSISMSKSLGYTVPEPITANIINLKEVPASLKGKPMLGFLGTFSVNFEIPDYWGIGKSVSRGFGTIKRVNESKS